MTIHAVSAEKLSALAKVNPESVLKPRDDDVGLDPSIEYMNV
jgi:hypothetical protein